MIIYHLLTSKKMIIITYTNLSPNIKKTPFRTILTKFLYSKIFINLTFEAK